MLQISAGICNYSGPTKYEGGDFENKYPTRPERPKKKIRASPCSLKKILQFYEKKSCTRLGSKKNFVQKKIHPPPQKSSGRPLR